MSRYSSSELADDIVAAYVANNSVPVSELPNLIQSVHGVVSGLASGSVPEAVAPSAHFEQPTPAEIRKSVRDDGIVSFLDGRIYKTLKRHLTSRGLDPRSYRVRFGLPVDYPMVAPNYAEQRSALAKAIGLGRTVAKAKSAPKGRPQAA